MKNTIKTIYLKKIMVITKFYLIKIMFNFTILLLLKLLRLSNSMMMESK